MFETVVCYHYIRDNSDLHALSIDGFKLQLAYFEGKSYLPTFDDGLKDGYDVFPLLKEFGVTGLFFLPTIIFEQSKVLYVQKRHLLLAKLGTEQFIEELNGFLGPYFHVDETLCKRNRYDNVLTSNLKYMLNVLEQTKLSCVLDIIFDRYFDEEKVFNELYLNLDDIKEMEDGGMIFGVHGHRHIPLGRVYFEDMQKDICDSVQVYHKIFNKKSKSISYPHGSYNEFVKRVARSFGIQQGFTIEKRKNDKNIDLLALGRFDANDY